MAEIQTYIRIACEGEKTEPNYFNEFLKAKGIKQANMAFKPKDNSPLGVALAAKEKYKEAIKLKIPKDKIFVWAVFDRDGHAGVKDAIGILKNTPIGIAFSNVCFEYWILLHFEKTSKAFANCDEIIKHIVENHDSNYAKSNDNYNKLKSKIQVAIDNANWLKKTTWRDEERHICDLNPYTDVQLIFESLLEREIIKNI